MSVRVVARGEESKRRLKERGVTPGKVQSSVTKKHSKGSTKTYFSGGEVIRVEEVEREGGVTTTKVYSKDLNPQEQQPRESTLMAVQDDQSRQSRYLTPIEQIALERASGGMTSAKTGEAVYVTYKKREVQKDGFRDSGEFSGRVSGSKYLSARDLETLRSNQSKDQQTQEVVSKNIKPSFPVTLLTPASTIEAGGQKGSAGSLLRTFRSKVSAPFGEGFSLGYAGDKYRGDFADPIASLSYGAGVASSIVTLSGAPAEKAGLAVSSRIVKSERLLSATSKISKLANTKTGKVLNKALLGAYGATTAYEFAKTPSEDKTRFLFGVGREVAIFTGFGAGLNKGFSLAEAKVESFNVEHENSLVLSETSKSLQKVSKDLSVNVRVEPVKGFRGVGAAKADEGVLRSVSRVDVVTGKPEYVKPEDLKSPDAFLLKGSVQEFSYNLPSSSQEGLFPSTQLSRTTPINKLIPSSELNKVLDSDLLNVNVLSSQPAKTDYGAVKLTSGYLDVSAFELSRSTDLAQPRGFKKSFYGFDPSMFDLHKLPRTGHLGLKYSASYSATLESGAVKTDLFYYDRPDILLNVFGTTDQPVLSLIVNKNVKPSKLYKFKALEPTSEIKNPINTFSAPTTSVESGESVLVMEKPVQKQKQEQVSLSKQKQEQTSISKQKQEQVSLSKQKQKGNYKTEKVLDSVKKQKTFQEQVLDSELSAAKMGLSLSPISITRSKTKTKSASKYQSRVASDTETSSKPDIISEVKSDVVSDTKIDSFIDSATVSTSKFKSDLTTKTKEPKPEFKPPKPFDLPDLGSRDSKRDKSLFRAVVKVKGRLQELGLPQSFKNAERLAEFTVKSTSARTFGVKSLASGKFVSITPKAQFRRKKDKKGLLVEKSKFAINTPGELSQITYKGLRAKKNKKVIRL